MHVRACALVLFLTLSSSSMISVECSSRLSIVNLFNQEIFKERKKVRIALMFSPQLDFDPYKIS